MEGEGQVNEFFNKTSTLKIISVLIAVLIWLYVLNTLNPYETAIFRNIPLKIENENYLTENDFVLKQPYRTTIDITVRGRHNNLVGLKDSDFTASIDFSQIKSAADRYLTIDGPYCKKRNVRIVSYNPEKIEIVLSRIKNSSFPLELSNNITTKAGYKIVSVVPSVDIVALEGEEALIDSVDKVVAKVDIKDLDKDITKLVNCKVLNKEGKEIPSLSKNLTVEVTVKVAKAVSVELVTSGTINPNYVEISRTVVPSVVYVSGPSATLSRLTELKTETVNINNLSGDLSTKASLILPENVKLHDAQPEVDVHINVEPIVTRSLSFQPYNVELVNRSADGSLEYKVKTENATVQLKGRKSLLESLSAATIKPTANVLNLPEGVHQVPLNLTLPDGVRLVQGVNIEVEITRTASPGG